MRRVYIIYSPTAWSTLDLNYKSLPSYGRLDVLFRSVLSAFKLKGGYRTDVEVVTVHDGPPDPPLTLVFKDKLLHAYSPKNEVELARASANCLNDKEKLYTLKYGLSKVISRYKSKGYYTIYLRENGKCIKRVLDNLRKCEEKVGGVAFIAGSHVDIPRTLETLVLKRVDDVASIGPTSYLTSQSIVLTNYFLDRYEIN